jgi:hypothetical protein
MNNGHQVMPERTGTKNQICPVFRYHFTLYILEEVIRSSLMENSA